MEMNVSHSSSETSSNTAEHEISEIFSYYAQQRDRSEQSTIVQMLNEIQEINGFLTQELKEQAAQTAGVARSLIDLLIKTHPSLKEAAYSHVITVCSGARCAKKDGQKIAELIRKELRVGKNNLSADGTCLLKTQNCLKQCRTSANFYIDDTLYSNVTPEKVPQILKQALYKS